MNFPLSRFGLAIAMSLSLGAAHAAGGITVTQSEAAKVTSGMSADEVRRAIGPPVSNVKYRSDPGPVWLYHVTDAIDPVFFEVSFDKDGKVAGTSQYVDPRAYTGK